MADDSDSLLSVAVEKAAKAVLDAVRAKSPSGKIAGRWRMTKHGDGSAHIINSDMAAVMTDNGHRHPLFGNRKHWYAENQRNPMRTGWAKRAADEGLDSAMQDIAESLAEQIARDFNQ
jgi:hypothetical protein